MPTAYEAIDAAIDEVTKARTRVSKIRAEQVSGIDAVASLKSTAYAWFNTHRQTIETNAPGLDLTTIDEHYTTVLSSTAKRAAKRTYLDALRECKKALITLRGQSLVAPASITVPETDDLAPDFSPVVGNVDMREILIRRWHECAKCVNAEAHLAAIVMMGGLLEALFVARANKMSDKQPLVDANAAPKDKDSGKTLDYTKWMLDSYIKVGHELGWISDSGKSVADVLKEYRNYIHPAKELRHGVQFEHNDSSMFWQVTKALARQLLMSASKPR